MRKTFFCLCLWLAICLAHTAEAKRTTVIISLDGYRWDYPQWYDTPFMDTLSARGVTAGLIPSFPSKTFPNHYTIATGLYPEHHGIIANEFYDPTTNSVFSLGNAKEKVNPYYYGGEPIWNTAHRQGKRVAVFYWPGSDVKINGRYPDKYYVYDAQPRLTLRERLNGVLDQLALPVRERPDLIMAYMEQPDANGHHFGPQSKRTRAAVQMVDSLLCHFYQRMQQLPDAHDINLIIVSDHGMTWVPKTHAIGIRPLLKPSWTRMISGALPCNIYVRPGCQDSVYQALAHLDHVKVWRKQDVPAYLHFDDSPRIGDVIICPDLGYVISDSPIKDGGTHGFDPTQPDMHALFRAVGPDFKHTEWQHFKNVDVYPLVCKILNIVPAPNDGNLEEVSGMLK